MANLKWRTLAVLSLLVVVAVALMAYSVRWPLVTFLNVIPEPEVVEPLRVSCQDVLKRMVYGRWETRSLSIAEEREIKLFNEQVRKEKTIPGNLQRSDKLCGNITFPKVVFRALCDANGDTPCCYNNVCTNRTKEQCTCAICYDTRRPLHAEYATWRPIDPTCRLRHFSQIELCHLLDGATLYFIGDSFVRHVYTAFLLAARNNEVSGAMRSNTPADVRTACSGLYMFTEKVCRLYVDGDTKVCNNRVKLRLFYYLSSSSTNTQSTIFTLTNVNRSIVFFGVGIHDHFNVQNVQKRLLLPLLQKMNSSNTRSPRLVWMAVHAPGLLRSPNFPWQSADGVLKYNSIMAQFLSQWRVPVFDAFNLTDGADSFDGEHYGLGVNRVKVQILLNYILELQDKMLW